MALTKISTGGVKDDTASQDIIADEAVDEARLQISNAGTNGQFLQKQSGNTGGLTWATVTVPDSDKIEEGNTSIETVDTGSDGHVKISTEGNERCRVDEDGRILVNTTTKSTSGASNHALLSIAGNKANATGEGQLNLWKKAVPGVNDTLGQINFIGDGGDPGAVIKAEADLAWDQGGDTTDHPGRLVFSTTADNDANVTERFRVGSSGQLGIAGANYGTSGQVLTSQGASSAPQWASPSGGLSEVDQWQYASDVKFLADSGNTLWLGEGTANGWNTGSPRSSGTFTRTPNIGFPVGTGISNTADSSSGSDRYGWFKFPSTGVYRIDMNLQLDRWSFSNKWVTYRTHWSTNGGTSFTTISEGLLRLENTYTKQMVAYATSFVNVTNTSNDIVKFSLETDNTSNPGGGDYAGVVQVKELSNVTFMKVN